MIIKANFELVIFERLKQTIMNTNKAKSNQKSVQHIQLVAGDFTVSEATDVVMSLIDEKINFHKLQRLSLSEGFSGADTNYPDDRIGQLEHEKTVALAFFTEARKTGATIKINGTLEISLST
jgi:translation elongation factor EF-Ts